MVDVTLLEVNLKDTELTANAPFSGSTGKSKAGKKVSKLLDRSPSSSSSSSESASSPLSSLTSSVKGEESSGGVDVEVEKDAPDGQGSIAPLVMMGALVVMFVVLRRLRGGDSADQHELADYEA